MATSIWGRAEKMIALHVAKTGHVLGAATRLAGAGTAVTPRSLAGDAMRVVKGGVETTLGFGLLATTEVQFNLETLRDPTEYLVEKTSVVLPAAQVSSIAVHKSGPGTQPARVTITLPANITKETDYVVRIESAALDGPLEVARAEAAKNPPVNFIEVILPREAATGVDYVILAAVAGHQLKLVTDKP